MTAKFAAEMKMQPNQLPSFSLMDKAESMNTDADTHGDPQTGAPEHRDQAAHAVALRPWPGLTHDRNDLLNPRRIRRIVQALVAWWTTRVVAGIAAGERRRPVTSSEVVAVMAPPIIGRADRHRLYSSDVLRAKPAVSSGRD